MSSRVKNWTVELVEALRDLFAPPCEVTLAAHDAPEWGLIGTTCSTGIRTRTAVQAAAGTFRFSQIKDKYDTLSVYWDACPSSKSTIQVEKAIALAEARTAACCEVCREPGRLHGRGRLTTRCATRPEVFGPGKVRPGFENIYIVNDVAGEQGQVACRRHDRESEAFTKVDLASLPIEG